MSKDVKKFTKMCLTCAKSKISNKKYGKYTPTNIQQDIQAFQYISADLMGPLPTFMDENAVEYKYILTIIDIYTRWIELIPLSNQTGPTVAAALDNWWFNRYPRPSRLLSDQGKNLIGKDVTNLCAGYGIKTSQTTAYSATANSICERAHGTINQILRTINVDNWYNNLQSIAFAMRASVNKSLQTTPAHLVFGLDLILPLYNDSKNPGINTQVQKDLNRRNKSQVDHLFKENDLILLRKVDRDLKNKWDAKQEGPYTIKEVHMNNTITIDKFGYLERVNIGKVIPWKRAKEVQNVMN